MIHDTRQADRRRGRPIADVRGVTMLEMLVVVLVIAILATMALPLFLNQRAKAQDSGAKLTLSTVAVAVGTYHTEHDTYDATKSELVAIEPALGEASAALSVSGTAAGFTASEQSATGTTFTLTQAADGVVARSCSDPGRGMCRNTPDADGNRW